MSLMRTSEKVPLVTLKLSAEKLEALVTNLDAVAESGGGDAGSNPRRAHERFTVRKAAMLVVLEQEIEKHAFVAPLRNISTGGLAFFHRNFVHKGTRCSMKVRMPNGDM